MMKLDNVIGHLRRLIGSRHQWRRYVVVRCVTIEKTDSLIGICRRLQVEDLELRITKPLRGYAYRLTVYVVVPEGLGIG